MIFIKDAKLYVSIEIEYNTHSIYLYQRQFIQTILKCFKI